MVFLDLGETEDQIWGQLPTPGRPWLRAYCRLEFWCGILDIYYLFLRK